MRLNMKIITGSCAGAPNALTGILLPELNS
jgi:hypothetical protein